MEEEWGKEAGRMPKTTVFFHFYLAALKATFENGLRYFYRPAFPPACFTKTSPWPAPCVKEDSVRDHKQWEIINSSPGDIYCTFSN